MKTGRYAVGLMSGTSMDGIDAALVEISGSAERPRVRLKAFEAFPYPADTRKALLDVASGKPATAGEISNLDYQVGELFARAALAVCRRGRIETARLSVIGSHGQTIFHQAPKGKHDSGGYPASTLQIGEPAVITERTRAVVVADFRAADIAAGGQGAPLVPLVDYLLLRDRRHGSIALNLGGIANITAIPANADMDEVFGFDTGPANMVIDGLAAYLTRGRMNYDTGGKWASRGKVIESLLAKMLRESFFAYSPPKSAGREQFGDDFLTAHFLSQKKTRPENLMRTATELTARSVAQAINQFVLPRDSFHRLIISGGGAHNLFLIERLRALLPSLTFHRSTDFGLPIDAKEAIAFALLADRTLHGLPGNLPAVTGARRAVVLGKIMRP
ncbi:MAG TPA: anhydro-N-acetylmuramic acid kinase [Terriglobia bacterium]|nr:anhydro-N-acetylmuramic acid kinase [Terriglobia bacterium]